MKPGEIRLLEKESGMTLVILAATLIIVKVIAVGGDVVKLLLRHKVLVAIIYSLLTLFLVLVSRL
jgi:hypothetical protein